MFSFQVKSGSGTLLVIAVGPLSFSGKIRAQVYGDNPDEEPSPLFTKLEKLALDIGKIGGTVSLPLPFAISEQKQLTKETSPHF